MPALPGGSHAYGVHAAYTPDAHVVTPGMPLKRRDRPPASIPRGPGNMPPEEEGGVTSD